MRVLALVVVGLVAGCTSAPDSTPAADSPDRVSRLGEEAALADQVTRFTKTYELSNSQSKLGELSMLEAGNCLLLSGGGSILLGNATVTWTASPSTPALELMVVDNGEIAAVDGGAGEASIAFGFVELPGDQQDTAISWEIARSEPAGLTYQVAGTLAIDLEVKGLLTVEEGYGCTYGR